MKFLLIIVCLFQTLSAHAKEFNNCEVRLMNGKSFERKELGNFSFKIEPQTTQFFDLGQKQKLAFFYFNNLIDVKIYNNSVMSTDPFNPGGLIVGWLNTLVEKMGDSMSLSMLDGKNRLVQVSCYRKIK